MKNLKDIISQKPYRSNWVSSMSAPVKHMVWRCVQDPIWIKVGNQILYPVKGMI